MEPIILSPPAGLCQWVQLYCLYRRSFPRSERKPFRIILKKYRAGNTHIWCILQTGKFLGFAATMNSPDLVMLDYLAISRKHRGRGIGTAAMTQLLARYRDRGFLLEIESPFEPGPDQALRQRRKQFYVNCGMEPLHIMAQVFGVPRTAVSPLRITGISTGTFTVPRQPGTSCRQSIPRHKKSAPQGEAQSGKHLGISTMKRTGRAQGSYDHHCTNCALKRGLIFLLRSGLFKSRWDQSFT